MALPTIVPSPTPDDAENASDMDVKSSGADEPAARNVAPATSSESSSASEIASSAGAKYSSQMIATPRKMYSARRNHATATPGEASSCAHMPPLSSSSCPRVAFDSAPSARCRPPALGASASASAGDHAAGSR